MEAFQNIQNMKYDLMRVLSLIASSTEIVYALGCGDKLVGRWHECDFPQMYWIYPTALNQNSILTAVVLR